MNINIAGNLKRLRKERGITQENLADFIGVSFQAVSKWECGDGYPDITILPVLATFFDVTLDELVGMNEIKDANKLEEIKKQAFKLAVNSGTTKEFRELYRSGLKIFPNNYWLLSQLVHYLSPDDNSDTDDEKKKNNEEAIKISERILEFCTDTEIRSKIQAHMCLNLDRAGEKDKAVELAKKLPKIHETAERTLTFILSGKEKTKQNQYNIYTFTDELAENIRTLVTQTDNDGYYTDEERLMLSQKAIDIYKTVYEYEEDLNYGHVVLRDIYTHRAKIYIKQDNKDKAVKSLKEVAKHTIAWLNMVAWLKRPPGTRKSLLVNMVGLITTMTGVNPARDTKNLIESEPFESIREREEIKNILAELDKYQ